MIRSRQLTALRNARDTILTRVGVIRIEVERTSRTDRAARQSRSGGHAGHSSVTRRSFGPAGTASPSEASCSHREGFVAGPFPTGQAAILQRQVDPASVTTLFIT